MKQHHTKQLGDLGVLKAQIDLFTKGYIISMPMTEHAPFDLIIYKDGLCKTVQVKARTLIKGRLEINFRNSYSDSKGVHTIPVDKTHIDIYCVYCPDTDECYYFDPKKFNKSITLRVEKPKNNQYENINFIHDYCHVP